MLPVVPHAKKKQIFKEKNTCGVYEIDIPLWTKTL